jgi:hypothetical protein
MRAGSFNFNEYLEKLNEEAEAKTTGFLDGGEKLTNSDGIIIPEENKKTFTWLKSEFQKGKTEVKVEMKLGNAKFEPGYDFTGGDPKSVKEFKPGNYGAIKTEDTNKKDGAVKKTEVPKSPNNKKEETSAESKDPKAGKEADGKSTKPNDGKEPKKQQMELNAKTKKDDKK